MAANSNRSIYKDYCGTQETIEYIPGRETGNKIWSRVWLPGLYNDNKKRVLIIGDAVTEGMSFYYEEFLGDDWCVHRQTGSISICDELYLTRLKHVLTAALKSYDVICFTPTVNFFETPGEFAAALEKAIGEIKLSQENAKLVFVANTMTNPFKCGKETNTKIFGYNRALELAAEKYNAEFSDLGLFSEKLNADRLDNGILFTDDGYKKLAFEVVKYFK